MRVKVPATSANFGIGFDVIGLSLNMYNEFEFILHDCFVVEGFETDTLESNLLYTTYLKLCNVNNIEPLPVKIKQLKCDIPETRGLGSSATCIIAASIAAKTLNNIDISEEELLDFMVGEEGHPDNIVPAYFGGFISSIYDNYKLKYYKEFYINDLVLEVLIPSSKTPTKKLRGVLPKTLSYHDVINNVSRVIHLPDALENGDISLLKLLLQDTLHEPYRGPHIKYFYDLKQLEQSHDCVFVVSGSGSTVLAISKSGIYSLLNNDQKEYFDFRTIEIGNKYKTEVFK